MATHIHRYKKSTFPPLPPVNFKTQINSNQEKSETGNKGRTRDSNKVLSDEEKEALIKQALQEKYSLETYKNLCKLRKILCERYRILLNEKVQKQRIQIKMSDLKFQQELKRKTKKHHPGHKMPFCKFSHDTKYLESIPQSRNYLIIGLQNELSKLRIIKNQQDYEDFWKLAQEGIRGSNLKEKLPDIKAKMFAAKSMFLSASARILPQQQVNGSTNSRRLKKSSLSSPQSTATCQPPIHHEGKQMNTQQETEQMFPKLLLSWLSEVQKRHGEPSQTQQVVTSTDNLHQNETFERRRKNAKHLHCLHHMYNFSLQNMVLSKRLLEENGQFVNITKEQSVHDLVEYLFPSKHEGSEMNPNRMIVRAKQQEIHHKDLSKIFRFTKENKALKQEKEKDLVKVMEDDKSNTTSLTKHEMIPIPLTLDDVALYNPVLEAKMLGNYWINYADQKSIDNYE
ncbi:uncharacterized protein LOC103280638 isoform X1 [Anolis carolinensis]|uniref:uncharacterized protein LOC103280638 isoform X1 n=1 Tax=Anolis carolinensis TaxID=28377 RepID=UPI002F2B8614